MFADDACQSRPGAQREARLGFLIVFVGAGIGGMARHGVGLAALRLFGPGFPIGTLLINVVGSALMGLVVALFAAFDLGQPDLRLFLTTGVLGGFTTFSAFSLDVGVMWERGDHLAAIGYLVASVVLSIAALFVALHLGRRLA